MHSFHPSRGRILFEVFCALAMSGACVGAWLQTGATALLIAASVAAVYGLVHLLDLAQHSPAEAEPQRIAFEPEQQGAPHVAREIESLAALVEHPLVVDERVEVVEPTAPALPDAIRNGQAKARRKGSGRKASTREEAKIVELAPPPEVEVAVAASAEEIEADEPQPREEIEVAAPQPADEVFQPQIEPLFEPEPFARMPRRAFGRRGRI